MTEPKPAGDKSWWTTLPGVLTGVAAMLTALGGLATAASPYLSAFTRTRAVDDGSRQRMDPKKPREPTSAPTTQRRVGEVWIGNLEIRRSVDRGTTSIDLYYRVTTGAGFVRHDPSRFVRVVSNGRAVAPSWAPPAMDMPAYSSQDLRVVFSVALTGPIVFRFGEEQPIDISLQ